MKKECFSPEEVKEKNKSSEVWTIVVVLAAIIFLVSQCIHYALNQNKNNEDKANFDNSSSGHGRMTRRRRKELSNKRHPVNNEALKAALNKHRMQKKYGGQFMDNCQNKALIESLI